MGATLRPLADTEADTDAVLRINEDWVHHLAPMSADDLAWYRAEATCAWAAEVDGSVAGFVLVLDPGLPYESENYRWFSERYDAFLYLDRVAVDERFHRRGVGTAIYEAVEAEAARRGVPLLLEVDLEPANEPSLAFHAGRGFRAVGTLEHESGKVVRLLELRPGG